ncbi:MAG: alpha/beta hydrolase [Culicoidibacterales bacterium]
MNQAYQISRNNYTLPIWIKGNTVAKVAILCLHGGPGKGSAYLQSANLFKQLEQEYLLIYFDQKGSNKHLSHTEVISEQQITDDVFAVVQSISTKIADKKLYLLGVSFGGCLGFLSIQRFSNFFEGYIALCPAVMFRKSDGIRRKKLVEAKASQIIGAEITLQQLKERPDFFALMGISYQHGLAMSNWFFTKTFLAEFDALALPTLIIQGNKDQQTPVEMLKYGLAKTSTKLITYSELDGYEHNLHLDEKNEIAPQIISFIENKL